MEHGNVCVNNCMFFYSEKCGKIRRCGVWLEINPICREIHDSLRYARFIVSRVGEGNPRDDERNIER